MIMNKYTPITRYAIAFAIVLTFQLLFLPAHAVEKTDGLKDLDPIIQSYQSESTRQFITKHATLVLASTVTLNYYESIYSLLDLHNDQISVWLLTGARADRGVSAIEYRNLTLEDATYLGYSAFIQATQPGERLSNESGAAREGSIKRLGKYFCAAIRQPYEDLESIVKNDVKLWMLRKIDCAVNATADEKRKLQLYLLRLNIQSLQSETETK